MLADLKVVNSVGTMGSRMVERSVDGSDDLRVDEKAELKDKKMVVTTEKQTVVEMVVAKVSY